MRRMPPMSTEDLERYEAELELQLYKEYKDVCPMFPTSWRPSGASTSPTRWSRPCATRTAARGSSSTCGDAWVWDMYRPTRFVSSRAHRHVQGRQRRGASQEGDLTALTTRGAAAGRGGRGRAAAWYEAHGYEVSTATGAAAKASSTSSSPRAAGRVLRGEDPHDRRFGVAGRGRHPDQAAAHPPPGRPLARGLPLRPAEIRFDVAAILGRRARDHRRRVLNHGGVEPAVTASPRRVRGSRRG